MVGVPNFCASRLLLAALTRLPAFVVYPSYSVGAILIVSLLQRPPLPRAAEPPPMGAVGMILAAAGPAKPVKKHRPVPQRGWGAVFSLGKGPHHGGDVPVDAQGPGPRPGGNRGKS